MWWQGWRRGVVGCATAGAGAGFVYMMRVVQRRESAERRESGSTVTRRGHEILYEPLEVLQLWAEPESMVVCCGSSVTNVPIVERCCCCRRPISKGWGYTRVAATCSNNVLAAFEAEVVDLGDVRAVV
jgi:hypothetical protein